MKLRMRPASTFLKRPGGWLLGQASTSAQRRVAIAVLVTAGLLLAAAVWQDQARRSQLQQLLASRGLVAPVVRRPAPVLSVQADRQRANHAIRQLNTPWPELFAMLEAQADPQAVALLSVEPNIDRGAVRIQTEGPLLDDLLTHASRLGQQPQVRQMQLLRVDEREAQGRRFARLTFDLTLAR